MNLSKIIHTWYEKIKSLFWSGFLTILPLALTLTLFAFLYRTVRSWIHHINWLIPPAFRDFPGSDFIVVILVILGIGAILKFFLLRTLIDFVENLFGRVPLLRQVYFGIKKLINAFGPKDKDHFQRVVLVEFPRKGTYSIGFLTNENATDFVGLVCNNQAPEKGYFNVFVPHTPNPTTGFFIVVPAEECIQTCLSRQEAMTMIISGGILVPERLINKK